MRSAAVHTVVQGDNCLSFIFPRVLIIPWAEAEDNSGASFVPSLNINCLERCVCVLCLVCLVVILVYGIYKLLSGNDCNPPNKYFQNKME